MEERFICGQRDLIASCEHDTHEAWGEKVCKDRPQVDLVKTGFLFEGSLSLNLEQ